MVTTDAQQQEGPRFESSEELGHSVAVRKQHEPYIMKHEVNWEHN